jgi:CRP-like cAMP-binding protein
MPAVIRLALSQKLGVLETDSVTPLFADGDVADSAYFVLEGEVSVGRNGRTLAILGPGGMLGLVACMDGGRRSASVVTSGPARLLRLARRDFEALFETSNKFVFHLVELVARQCVSYLRHTNPLLGMPHPLTSTPVNEALLPEAEILPLEFEIEVGPADEPLV